METRTSRLFGAALLGALLVAPAAHANMYKWVAEDGTITYSNTPPPDRAKVKDFTKIDDINTVPPDKRPKAANAEAPRAGALAQDTAVRPDAVLKPEAPPAKAAAEAAVRSGEPVAVDTVPRAVSRGIQTDAVQDPCLRSPDPQCYQKNKDKYHPYLGYAPSASKPAVGATGSTGAGGAVGGQISIVPSAAAAEKRPAATQVVPAIEVKTK